MRRAPVMAAIVFFAGVFTPTSAAAVRAGGDFMICEDGQDCVTHGKGRTLILDQAHGRFGDGVQGRGTYRVTDRGKVVERGSWTAKRLLFFHSFGAATPEQVREIRQTFGFTLPKGSIGGRLVLRVGLSDGREGIMKIDCLLGNTPSNAKEGVRLSVLGGTNFNRVVEFPEAGGTLLVTR